MKFTLAGSVLLLAWIALTFGMGLESGWVHLSLVAGVVLLAMGIVLKDGQATKDHDSKS